MLTKSPPISIDGQQAVPTGCPVGSHTGFSGLRSPNDVQQGRISAFVSGEPTQFAGSIARIPGRQWAPARLELESRVRALELEIRMDEIAFAERAGR